MIKILNWLPDEDYQFIQLYYWQSYIYIFCTCTYHVFQVFKKSNSEKMFLFLSSIVWYDSICIVAVERWDDYFNAFKLPHYQIFSIFW